MSAAHSTPTVAAQSLAEQLAPIADCLTKAMSGQGIVWRVEPATDYFARILADNGAGLCVNISHKHPLYVTQWAFAPIWPRSRDGLEFRPPGGSKTVRVSADRQADTLAKDVTRRLVDAYLADLPTYRERADEHDRMREAQIAIARAIASKLSMGKVTFHGTDCPQLRPCKHGVREVKVYSDGTVAMELSSINADTAVKVVELLVAIQGQ